MEYKAFNNYIVVDKIKEAPKVVAGMEITEVQNKDLRYFKGIVLEPGKFSDHINKGRVIWYDRHAAHQIDINGNQVFVIRIEDIAIISDETIS
jgi:co-chaperonin GroES (HSP10)